MTDSTRPDREPATADPGLDAPAGSQPATPPDALAGSQPATPPDALAGSQPATPPEAASPTDPVEAAATPVPVEPVAVDAATPVPVEPVTPVPVTPAGRRPAAILGYLGVAILGIVIGAGALAVATGQLAGPSPSPSPTPAPSEAPAGNVVGQPDAPVTIEIWADYQCPYCRLEDFLFGGALEREYVTPGVARLVYRDFAFLGQESTDAAVAARCAGAQEPAAQMRYHDALYTFQQGENQGRFVRENLVQIAEIAGVPDAKAFAACLDDPAVAAAVAAETTEGRNVGVSSTPTLRLRGPGGERVMTGFSQTWPPLRDAIEAVRVAAPASPSPGGSTAPSPSGNPAPSPSGSSAPSSSPTVSASPPASGSPAP